MKLRLQTARVVDRLVGEPAGQRAVADDRDDRLVAAREVARLCHPERGRNRRRRVARAEGVVRGLAAHREAGEPAALAERAERGRRRPVRILWT